MSEIYLLACAAIGDGGGVYKYRLNECGKPEKLDYLQCDMPMYAVLAEQKLHVLLRAPFEANDNSGYFSCRTDFTDCSAIKNTLGKCACHLAVDGDTYVVNYLSGNIVKNCEKEVMHAGKGVNLPRQDMPHTHFATFSPDKKYVLCCDLGLDSVFIYDRDLNEISVAKVPDGFGVRHLTFSEDGEYFYAVNELVPSVSVFSYRDGRARYLDTVKLDCKSDAVLTAAAIRSDAAENKLYVSVRGENELFVLNVCGEKLSVCDRFTCGGEGPRDFDVVGDYIVCTNENSDNVTIIDKKSHRVIDEITLKGPLNVVKAE